MYPRCQYCYGPIKDRNGEWGFGRKARYCCDAHKQAAYRERKAILDIRHRQLKKSDIDDVPGPKYIS